MENRFTVKDLVYFAVLGLIILLILLAMYQVDRQWLRLTQMEQSLREQAEDLRGLRQMLATGAPVAAGRESVTPAEAEGSGQDIPPVFRRAWQATRQPDYAQGDWLVESFGVNLKSITPFISEDAYAAEVQGYVLESLLVRDPDTLQWQGLLARDWDVSKDGLTFRFRLRPEARFSDGEPVTAEDVAFSWRFIMNEAIQAPRERAYYRKIDRVSVLGPHEVEFHFSEPYYDALSLAG
ncbi:MAG: ABC transporter substrate-binding protein, partial [Gammaproteobacteria bacterium]